jgi:hypothetical protein
MYGNPCFKKAIPSSQLINKKDAVINKPFFILLTLTIMQNFKITPVL